MGKKKIKNGFYLYGHLVEYMNIRMPGHYKYDRVFTTTKLLERITIQLSQTGIAKFSNAKLIEDFGGIDRRTLQIAANQIERELGVIGRIYKDDGKYHRLGWTAVIDELIDLLSLRPDDVKDLPRGNIKKSFTMQKAIVIKTQAKEIKRLLRKMKNDNMREIYQAKINDLQAEMIAYNNYIEERAKQANKSISNAKKKFTQQEIMESGINLILGYGYEPPETYVN